MSLCPLWGRTCPLSPPIDNHGPVSNPSFVAKTLVRRFRICLVSVPTIGVYRTNKCRPTYLKSPNILGVLRLSFMYKYSRFARYIGQILTASNISSYGFRWLECLMVVQTVSCHSKLQLPCPNDNLCPCVFEEWVDDIDAVYWRLTFHFCCIEKDLLWNGDNYTSIFWFRNE